MQGALRGPVARGSRSTAVSVECGPSSRCLGRSTTRSRPTRGQKQPRGRRLQLAVRAGPVEYDENDLMQAPDRIKWYESKFCADDMPDWNIGRFLRSENVAPGLRSVVLECEISRERVPLRNAYKFVGQRASVRVNQGLEYRLPVHNPPFPAGLNKEALFNTRGDLFAYEVKTVKEPTTVMTELHLLVSREEAPEVYDLEIDDAVETGPFVGGGLALRNSPVMAVYRYPTVVIFVTGITGIATCKALLEAPGDVANLGVQLRQDVRVYYKVPNKASACFTKEAQEWEKNSKGKIKVFVTTSSFQDAFDDDDTLTYNPLYTAAILLTGGDPEAEAEALEVCKEGEISQVLTDAAEQGAVKFLSSLPTSFTRWVKQSEPDTDDEEEPKPAAVAAAANGNGNGNGNGRGARPSAGAATPTPTAAGNAPPPAAPGTVGKGLPRARR